MSQKGIILTVLVLVFGTQTIAQDHPMVEVPIGYSFMRFNPENSDIVAQNRRVNITLSSTGQRSVRQLPFNAKDALTLLSPKWAEQSGPHRKTVVQTMGLECRFQVGEPGNWRAPLPPPFEPHLN